MLCCLNYIHSAGLMHRDIKMDNILINGNCVTKLCDFGYARPCPESNNYIGMCTPSSKNERNELYQKLKNQKQ